MSAETVTNGAKLQPHYLSVKAMCERLDVSESTFHRMRDEEWFPRPVELSPKVIRWIATEVDEALLRRAPRLAAGAAVAPSALLQASKGRRLRGGMPA